MCRANADSYAYCAIKVLWTHNCAGVLKKQGGRFDDLLPPSQGKKPPPKAKTIV